MRSAHGRPRELRGAGWFLECVIFFGEGATMYSLDYAQRVPERRLRPGSPLSPYALILGFGGRLPMFANGFYSDLQSEAVVSSPALDPPCAFAGIIA